MYQPPTITQSFTDGHTFEAEAAKLGKISDMLHASDYFFQANDNFVSCRHISSRFQIRLQRPQCYVSWHMSRDDTLTYSSSRISNNNITTS
jgi:hypothetical protein